MSRRLVWGTLLVVVVAILSWVAWPRGSESVDERADRIASELRCVECEGLSIADAATSTARATRAEIRERIEAGESDAEIRQAYLDRYGEWALMNPSGQGVGVLVWALPVIVVALGGAGVALAVARGRRTPRLAASPADEAMVVAASSSRAAAASPLRPASRAAEESEMPVEPLGDTLEEERDFLLRSLEDLDAEYAQSNIDAETYTALHADYTARAAAVLRAIEGGDVPDVDEVTSPTSWKRRAVVLGSIATFATIAGVMLALAVGARLPGGLPTGDDVAIGAEEREERLRQALVDNPDDPSVHLSLANFLVQRDDLAEALPLYDTAARLDPTDASAPTQAGWLLYLTALSATDTQQQEALLDGARDRLDTAVTIDPDHAEARFFRGVVLLRGFDDADAAIPELQRFLVLAPDHELAEQVRALLAEAVEVAETDAPRGSG